MGTEPTRARVLETIEADHLAADLRLSLFVSALKSYRHDSVLRPFPPSHLKEDGTKDARELASTEFLI